MCVEMAASSCKKQFPDQSDPHVKSTLRILRLRGARLIDIHDSVSFLHIRFLCLPEASECVMCVILIVGHHSSTL